MEMESVSAETMPSKTSASYGEESSEETDSGYRSDERDTGIEDEMYHLYARAMKRPRTDCASTGTNDVRVSSEMEVEKPQELRQAPSRDVEALEPTPEVVCVINLLPVRACGKCVHCKKPPCGKCMNCLTNHKVPAEKYRRNRRRCKLLTCERWIAARLRTEHEIDQDLERIRGEIAEVEAAMQKETARQFSSSPGNDEKTLCDLFVRKYQLSKQCEALLWERKCRSIHAIRSSYSCFHEIISVVRRLERERRRHAEIVVRKAKLPTSRKHTLETHRRLRDSLARIIAEFVDEYWDTLFRRGQDGEDENECDENDGETCNQTPGDCDVVG